jgi:hypothetical protein
MGTGMGALTVHAAGNVFAGPIDCSAQVGAIFQKKNCNAHADVGVVDAPGTTVTVDVAGCN